MSHVCKYKGKHIHVYMNIWIYFYVMYKYAWMHKSNSRTEVRSQVTFQTFSRYQVTSDYSVTGKVQLIHLFCMENRKSSCISFDSSIVQKATECHIAHVLYSIIVAKSLEQVTIQQSKLCIECACVKIFRFLDTRI